GIGTVFAVNTDGTGFTNLHSFGTGSLGGEPYAGVILSGDTLYGTTEFLSGTVFAINKNGTGFTTLHNFARAVSYTNEFGGMFFTNTDGASPVGSLILSGNTLYGTASRGSSSGNGTVFAINTDGTGFTNL